MGAKTVYTDDHDNKNLGDDVEPYTVVLGDMQWTAYLSDKNKAALIDLVQGFVPDVGPKKADSTATQDAPAASTSGSRGGPSRAINSWLKDNGHDATKIKAWLKENNIAHAEKGNLSLDAKKQYVAAHGGNADALTSTPVPADA